MVVVFATTTAACSSNGSPSATPSVSAAPTATESCVARVLASMSPGQRVGQLLAVGLADNRVGRAERLAIRSEHLGTVWFVHKSTRGVAGIRAVTDAVQALATTQTTAGVRLFVAANQEGGLIQSMTGPGFSVIPSAVAQGAMSPARLRRDAQRWGRQLRAAGVTFDYAPVMDVVAPGTDSQNQPIGVPNRGYGHTSGGVTAHGVAFIQGMAAAGVATSAKPFPGLGRVVGNTDFTADVIDRVTTRDDPYLQTFAASVRAGVPFVMVALATYEKIDPDHLAAFSPIVIRQLLRRDLGFQGVVISDDIGAAIAVAKIPPARRAIDFLLAGGDMIIAKTIGQADPMYRAVLARVTSDPGFAKLVDSSTKRVLRAKQAVGLLPCGS